ncbi:MAG: coproporphyrinogen III oxidase family protein [Spirochaetales bacterium]|nr:coproporphyrinogen III oxidase family protein [Spirochaetales bacterium]
MKKCFYCDFYSVRYSRDLAQIIIEEILKELHFFFHTGKHIRTIYIGGGTPSCLDPDIFEKLLKGIVSLNPASAREWTVEANPESLGREFILLCRRYYVTRLSIGIQSTEDSLLKVLGRKTTFSDIERSAELLNQYWDGELNVDLITGIPGQSQKIMQRDIDFCLKAFHPGHISLYSLTIEEGTELGKQIREKRFILPSPETGESLWFEGYRILESNKLFNYEISNFSKRGKESLHNIRYWRLNPYIGIGPGAVSTLPGEKEPVIRMTHPEDIELYIKSSDNFWGMTYETIDAKTFLFETCMMGFRLKKGIQKQEFMTRFGLSLPALVPVLWEKWEKNGWANQDQSTYRLSKKGRLMLNTLLAELSEAIKNRREKVMIIQWPGYDEGAGHIIF